MADVAPLLTFIGVVITFIGVMVSAFVSYRNSRKITKLSIEVDGRLSELIASSHAKGRLEGVAAEKSRADEAHARED